MEQRKRKWSGLLGLSTVAAVLLISGCAAVKPMPLSEGAPPLDLSKEGVAIFTVRTSNQYKAGYQPNLHYVHVKQIAGEKKETFSFSVTEPVAKVASEHRSVRASGWLRGGLALV